MIAIAFIDDYPCDKCSELKRVDDCPPYTRCRLSPTGDLECERMQAVARVADRCEQVAALISREPDRRLRAAEAGEVADAYANTFFELEAGFDDTAFLAACHVPRSCINCDERRADDGYTRKCEACEVVVVAS
jgi:hypothetical protein